MRSAVPVAALLLALLAATPSRAQDPGPRPKPGPDGTETPDAPAADPAQRRREAALAARAAATAFAAGDFDGAARAWQRAAELRPEEPAFRFNQGVSEERAGRRQPADEAYRAALTGARSEVEQRALFNVGSLALEDALAALDMATGDEDRIAAALAGQATDPDGEPLAGPRLDEATQAMRQQAVSAGLERAGVALDHLRELVRRDRDDHDGLHNLELAQRARKRLLEVQREMDQSGKSDQEKQKKEDDQRQSGEKGDNQQQGDPESSKDTSENESQQKQDESADANRDDPNDGSADDPKQQEGPARQLTEEQAKRLLDQMLEQARQKTREVQERRRNAARRTPVEKDW